MYQGYKNYQTWAVRNWINNELGTNGFFQDITARIFEVYYDHDEAIETLANSIQDIIEDDMPYFDDSAYDNLFTNIFEEAIKEIDFKTLAAEMLDYEHNQQM